MSLQIYVCVEATFMEKDALRNALVRMEDAKKVFLLI